MIGSAEHREGEEPINFDCLFIKNEMSGSELQVVNVLCRFVHVDSGSIRYSVLRKCEPLKMDREFIAYCFVISVIIGVVVMLRKLIRALPRVNNDVHTLARNAAARGSEGVQDTF